MLVDTYRFVFCYNTYVTVLTSYGIAQNIGSDEGDLGNQELAGAVVVYVHLFLYHLYFKIYTVYPIVVLSTESALE